MDVTSADLGLLLLRVMLAGILFTHATQKLLGWFSGAGLPASAALFEKLGQRPGRVMVVLAAGAELVSAAGLAFGLFTPVAAAIGMGTMIVAGATLVQASKAFWNTQGGGEYPLFIAGMLVVVAFTGPGAVAVDPAGVPFFEGGPRAWLGIAAVLLALVAAIPPIVNGRRTAAAL